jgi:hypothetical protein
MRRAYWTSFYTRENFVKALLFFILVVAALRLILILNLPILFLPQEPVDDGLYMRLATSLATGHWLGAYDEYTLVKGPGYPAFLAVTGLSGLPLSLTSGLFEIAAIAVTAWAAFRLTGLRAIGALTFLALALHPAGFLPDMTRVIRDQIYWAQTLLVFSSFALVLFAPPRGRYAAIALSSFTGIVLGWTWLSREESIWFLPGLAVLALGAVAINRKDASQLRAVALRCGLAALLFFAVIAAFMTANLIKYGAFVGIEINSGNFPAALDALQDVDAGPIKPHVPVPLTTRSAVAMVSPTFKPLRDALAAGGSLAGYGSFACEFYVDSCGDIGGGWFMWAFRDAGSLNGFYQDAATSNLNFGKIADDIAAACSDGRLTCRHRWFSHVPAMTADQFASLPGSMKSVAEVILFPFPGAPYAMAVPRWELRSEDFQKYWTFLNQPFAIARANTPTKVLGWYRDSASTQWPVFRVKSYRGENVPFSLQRLASPDLQQADNRLDLNRFEISYECPDVCSVAAGPSDQPELRLTIERQHGKAVSGSTTLVVDRVTYEGQLTGAAYPTKKFAESVRMWLVQLYQILHPLFVISGLVAMVVAGGCALAARALNPALVVAAAAWTLIATRIVILALIDISSFPAAYPQYTAPAAYLAVVAATFSIAAAATYLRAARSMLGQRSIATKCS